MLEMKESGLFDTDEDDFDTVMADDISFSGKIHFSKPFMIKGRVEGSIVSTSDLLVDTGAVVNADITAGRVMVRGKVNGNISGGRLIYVTASGSIHGDITAQEVVLEPKADFSGRCTMIRQTEGE
ncbi:MAG TPA: hypothetical protein DDW78_10420 [Treponema sp.]|nr:hypothetical protein [Treponema sp.]